MTSVLLVDDSATVRASIQTVLEENGHVVRTAEGGQDALDLLSGWVPDIVLTDLNMPQMDGLEFLRRIRGTPALRFVPVLVLTSESHRTPRDEAKAAGATGWIMKPVKVGDLLEVIRTVVPAP